MNGDKSGTFLKLYPANSDSDVAAQQKAVALSKRVYTYYFDRVLPWPAHPEFGAFHTSEVPYIFQTLDKLDRPWEPADKSVSDTVSSYWVNFAKKGDPTGSGFRRGPHMSPTRTRPCGSANDRESWRPPTPRNATSGSAH